jgi:hypothetical protein
MNKSRVFEELLKVQKEYLNLLKHIESNKEIISSLSIIDNVLIFWRANQKFIEYILSEYFKSEETSVFTAIRKINLIDNEQIPFLLLNKFHIYDDRIPTYLDLQSDLSNDKFSTKFHNDILELINDNIQILERYFGSIILIPISFMEKIESEDREIVDSIFFGLFSSEYNSFEEYRDDNASIDDIRKHLDDGVESHIIFSVDENPKDDFIQRFRAYTNSTELPLKELKSDSEKFSFIIMGYLIQAYNCLNIMLHHKFVPYIRNRTSLNYTLIMISGLNDDGRTKAQGMINKMLVYYLIHNSIDKSRVGESTEKVFLESGVNKEVEKTIFDELCTHNHDFMKIEFQLIVEIINRNLKRIEY